ncbi:hypothetical protein Acr_07g0005140 [Actinidia rufa]|uniref:Uncharacterized protein n=1 Tax=Actinidia rufa TaxID=165716 RepID=A0A7J0EXJ3_9ERIC|nr:hypothetical protein Acr_07g0005140 [Actinidia rufa]
MGGKGRKRREKNYRAAHGGHSRLPPPPNHSSVDALPSKLRHIMAFTNPSQPGLSNEQRNGGGERGSRGEKKLHSTGKLDPKPTGVRGEGNDGDSVTEEHLDHDDEILQNVPQEKRKKTKKRKRVSDLRFETLEESGVGSKRREHKKKRLEAKKNKNIKPKSEENEDFPRREQIKFGEVVQAPPKLTAFPKALKTTQDASQERLRIKAVEAYRNRKGWASRPGMDVPLPIMTSPSL